MIGCLLGNPEMARRPRVVIEGGLYHVYNRDARRTMRQLPKVLKPGTNSSSNTLPAAIDLIADPAMKLLVDGLSSVIDEPPNPNACDPSINCHLASTTPTPSVNDGLDYTPVSSH